ncbi:hypothetical protein DMP12_03860 [Gordonibacter urolithinfaciens]|jgi:hypothetical protein|uniref:Uncharacterized protein n=1 Tax=Gordonibacter urolithinfaciens TaxID=1335613 RepID=A0A423UMB6_9ACTN|nr:hypothetical protein DMP12_03860 [Gordonibacter urolithinfaciens]
MGETPVDRRRFACQSDRFLTLEADQRDIDAPNLRKRERATPNGRQLAACESRRPGGGRRTQIGELRAACSFDLREAAGSRQLGKLRTR